MWTAADLTAVEDAIRGLVADPTASYEISGRKWAAQNLDQLRTLRNAMRDELIEQGVISRPGRSIFAVGRVVW